MLKSTLIDIEIKDILLIFWHAFSFVFYFIKEFWRLLLIIVIISILAELINRFRK